MPIKTIICDKCNKPVSRTVTTYDRNLDVYNVMVVCHGQIERATLPTRLFQEGWYITEARAFKPRDSDLPAEKASPEATEAPTRPLLCLTYLDTGKTEEAPVEQIQMEDWVFNLKDAI